MKNRILHSRKARYRGVTLTLTVAVVAAIILFNAIFSALCERFLWYGDMTESSVYSVSPRCEELLGSVFERYTGKKVHISFLQPLENVQNEATTRYVYNTAQELQKAFPDTVTIDFLDILTRPDYVKDFEGTIKTTSVLIRSDDETRVITLAEFFTFSVDDSETPLAYNGDMMFAVAMTAVLRENAPVCYLTWNHGEAFYDYELVYTLIEAGYTVGPKSYLDLLKNDIPDDCGLLVTYNPAQDFTVSDGVSSIDEIDRLDAYLQQGGNYMIFVSPDTFNAGGLPHLETYLDSYGVNFAHHTEESGVEATYAVKDPGQAFSADGYTFMGDYAAAGAGGSLVADLRSDKYPARLYFKNATVITPAEGYTLSSDNTYTMTADTGVRTLTAVLTSGASAEAWAGGAVAAQATGENRFSLLTVTKDAGTGSTVAACTSTDFAAEDALQSIVYGNRNVLFNVLSDMGAEFVPTGLKFKPFSHTQIESITTVQKTRNTVLLTVIPAVLALGIAIPVLIRRKYA